MKYAALLIAGAALAGCDITLGANGPVITQSDSIISQVVPIGNRTAQAAAATETGSIVDQTSPTAAAAAPAASEARPRGTRIPILVSGVKVGTALPLGVTRNHVDAFKTAVADAGCIVTTSQDRAAIQSQTGFDDERTDRIIGYVWRTGELDRRSGYYQLTSGRCSDA